MHIKNIMLCLVFGLMFSDTQNKISYAAAAAANEDCVCTELIPIDVWFKISNDPKNYGRIMELDMSNGWSGEDQYFVYISVIDISTGLPVMLQFPLNDWFHTEYIPYVPPEQKPKPSPENKDEYFEWLKKNGNSIEIKN